MTTTHDLPQAKYLKDYQSPDYTISHIDLEARLDDMSTQVTAILDIERQGNHQKPLMLDGSDLELISISLDGIALMSDQYVVSETHLTVYSVPDKCQLRIVNQISPVQNKSLEGLYKSDGAFCTQCEAEGFRRITYYLDRPDVLATYHTTIVAKESEYPYLLSNGNLVETGSLEQGYHYAKWEDPFPKPCYLFALVAGNFDKLSDEFVTASQRQVQLEIYVDQGNVSRAEHAMDSLKRSMRWDEEVYGLEYDLDRYMIVAVDFFNMGAMENKGLNLFNSKYVLADKKSATDTDYHGIESVIAHEYFHNWTGNRVTCRDWFQLSLKEGLTVFRDQEFSADMGSRAVNRIQQVDLLRSRQFSEDAGPMAHPIRPEKVIEMNNFYTATVYDKGAEVIRMIHTLLGQSNFRKGMDLYFERHDGQAVTCDDFVQAMQDASGIDLEQFKRWYFQAGTPTVSASWKYDVDQNQLTLSLSQRNDSFPENKPSVIPVKLQFISEDGQSIAINTQGDQSQVLILNESTQTFQFDRIESPVIPVLFEGFSAPVKLEQTIPELDLLRIVQYAQDGFARWDAMQSFCTRVILTGELSYFDEHKSLYQALLQKLDGDLELYAELLEIPDIQTLAEQVDEIDVFQIQSQIDALKESLANALSKELIEAYHLLNDDKSQDERRLVGVRALKNQVLLLLAHSSEQDAISELAKLQYTSSDTMTEQLGALKAAKVANTSLFAELMKDFDTRWQHDGLIMDKWFGLYAQVDDDDTLSRLEKLQSHRSYNPDNPNRVRALIGQFIMNNPKQFHRPDGKGYALLTSELIRLNESNPQVASRLITPLLSWKKYSQPQKKLMQMELQRLSEVDNLSPDLYEKVEAALS
ncbi:aminopeptidase N [Algicola sagamiensis]|uniref:aminopeptidase N n=1 Tax=Algicola sagamiensis TaxID=163869 RepID=UPI000380CB94|nr:aminopeptidase N [Algicola sagamiensis]